MYKLLTVICLGTVFAAQANAEVLNVRRNDGSDMSLSIYANTALVQDTRRIKLPGGKSSILFSGVSEQLRPETVIVNADDVRVREQNYNFAMLSPENVARENIGKIVKTVMWDEGKGKNIYDKARIIDVYAGRPVLQFGYGVEFDFPGRIIWDELPDKLQTEPSLSLGVETKESGEKKLQLMYLTGGLRWNTDYVAEFVGENELNLKAWVSIHNTSGIAYDNAKVQLAAGEANVIRQVYARPMMTAMATRKAESVVLNDAAGMPTEESVGEYHVYSLPERISIANQQTKQVSLLSKDKIKYKKEYKLASPLYLGFGSGRGDFTKQNTVVAVKLTNNEENNLGEPLPQGTMRFYDRDGHGNMLFAGEAAFRQMSVGEENELQIGKSFDVTASGKVLNIAKIADNTVEVEASVSFLNAKGNAVQVVFDQYLHDNWSLVSANIDGNKTNAGTMQWKIDVPARGSAVLNFKIRFVKVNG